MPISLCADGPIEFNGQLNATLVALRRYRAACNQHQAAQVLHHVRTWQVERRKYARYLIELDGLVIKAGIVGLTDDDWTMNYGALLRDEDKLNSDDGEQAREL